MKFFVIGITGKRGSGKDTVAEHLESKYGFHVLTYLDHVLAPVLKKEGKEITRENLINLALDMRKKKGNVVNSISVILMVMPWKKPLAFPMVKLSALEWRRLSIFQSGEISSLKKKQ